MATFTVTIPLATQAMLAENRAEETSGAKSTFHTLKKVLIVADEPDSQEIIAFILENAGPQVVVPDSSAAAMASLTQAVPDIIISDVGTPEMGGYELISRIRALPPEKGGEVPVIALIVYAGELDFERALSAGFQRHLTKPVEPNYLLQVVEELRQASGER